MAKKILIVLALAFIGAQLPVHAAPVAGSAKIDTADATADGDIRAVLDAQVAAWNRGDLTGFMQGYWHSTELTFYSGNAVTSGWQATLDRYKKRYQSPGNEMGKLDFSQLEIHPAGDMAWVGGHWHLKMPDGSDRGGVFTLVFRKLPEGWKIVHDHTC